MNGDSEAGTDRSIRNGILAVPNRVPDIPEDGAAAAQAELHRFHAATVGINLAEPLAHSSSRL
jgi:hypothetical protein